MTPETARILTIAQGMAKSQAALGNAGSALAWSTVAGEIERLAAQLDVALSACAMMREMLADEMDGRK